MLTCWGFSTTRRVSFLGAIASYCLANTLRLCFNMYEYIITEPTIQGLLFDEREQANLLKMVLCLPGA